MPTFWSGSVLAAVSGGQTNLYVFVALQVDVQLQKGDSSNNSDLGIFLSNYHGPYEIDGNEYVSDLFQGVSLPPVTGSVTQELQTIYINQQLSAFGQEDVYALLGDNYHQAGVIITSYAEDSQGNLVTGAGNSFYRSDGIITSVTRDVQNAVVALEISNSFGQLGLVQELRTTVGSMARIDASDSCFNKAAAIDPTVTLQWGQEV